MSHPIDNRTIAEGNPVAKSVGLTGGSNILLLEIGAGLSMQAKKAKNQTQLWVLSGFVVFSTEKVLRIFYEGDEQDIPPSLTHTLRALADSLCLLIQQ